MLHRAAAIRFVQKIVPGRLDIVVVRAAGRTLIVDLFDNYDIDKVMLDKADGYAKRGFRLDGYDDERIFPYGLNYAVYPAGPDLRIVARNGLRSSGHIGGDVLRALAVDRVLRWPTTSRVSDIRPHAATLQTGRPAVVCFTRLWRPEGGEIPDDPSGRAAMNQHRIDCLRALRRELGPRFVGGVRRSRYALEQCPDCVVDRATTGRGSYLDTVARTPIGVTTAGLERSVGYRMGEFVAMGRAIVTEPLFARAPGLLPDVNYLTFTSPDDCVAACVRLIEHPDELKSIADANAAYYEEYLRPDRVATRLLRSLDPTIV